MIFDPRSNELFTDAMVLIKKLECPFKIAWSQLEATENAGVRSCSKCDHEILDTKFLNDKMLLAVLKKNPNTCFKIDLMQKNMEVLNNEKE